MPSQNFYKPCQHCKGMIAKSSKVCSHCGKSQRSMPPWWVFAIGIVGGLWWLGNASDTTVDQPLANNEAQHVSARSIPLQQQQFVDAVDRYRQFFRQSANEIQESQARQGRAGRVRELLPARQAEGWVGEVATLQTNSEGKAILSIEIGDDIYLKTWNNALSDIGSRTLIEVGSPVYEAITPLSNGDRVRVSGEFLSSSQDFLNEGSLTIRGSMTKPEYLFRFASVETVR